MASHRISTHMCVIFHKNWFRERNLAKRASAKRPAKDCKTSVSASTLAAVARKNRASFCSGIESNDLPNSAWNDVNSNNHSNRRSAFPEWLANGIVKWAKILGEWATRPFAKWLLCVRARPLLVVVLFGRAWNWNSVAELKAVDGYNYSIVTRKHSGRMARSLAIN